MKKGVHIEKEEERKFFLCTYFQRSELNSPANGGVERWRLEPHTLPVCRLDILTVVEGEKINTLPDIMKK